MLQKRSENIKTIESGTYDELILTGSTQCEGEITAQRIQVEGTLRCQGKITAGILRCNGTLIVSGDVSAKEINSSGMLHISHGGKLEGENIRCEGMLHADEGIRADVFEMQGVVTAQEITGKRVTVHSRVNKLTKLFIRESQVKEIQAEVVDLMGVSVQNIIGEQITIGPHCEVQSIDCSGTLSLDKKAKAGQISGDYVMK